jgi:negative regulator of flagellin synthesis FlgM
MKVNNKATSGAQAANIASTGATTRTKASDKAGKNAPIRGPEDLAGSAKINMSERAQMMSKAKEIAKSDTVDEARVAHLQKMIDSGKYNVDAAAVADRLVDEHLATGE